MSVQMFISLADAKQNKSLCIACNSYYGNAVDHCIHECSSLVGDRAKLWQDIQGVSMNACAFCTGKTILLCLMLFVA